MPKNITTRHTTVPPSQVSTEWLEDSVLNKLAKQTHYLYKVKFCSTSLDQREVKVCIEESETNGTHISRIVIDFQKDLLSTFITVMGLNDTPELIGDIIADI